METNFLKNSTAMVLTNTEDLLNVVSLAVQREFRREREKDLQHLYTINTVAKKLGKSHQTIKKYVMNGVIASTANGLISQESIEKFINHSATAKKTI